MNNGDADARSHIMRGLRPWITAAHRAKQYQRRNDLMAAHDDASLSRFQESEADFLARTKPAGR